MGRAVGRPGLSIRVAPDPCRQVGPRVLTSPVVTCREPRTHNAGETTSEKARQKPDATNRPQKCNRTACRRSHRLGRCCGPRGLPVSPQPRQKPPGPPPTARPGSPSLLPSAAPEPWRSCSPTSFGPRRSRRIVLVQALPAGRGARGKKEVFSRNPWAQAEGGGTAADGSVSPARGRRGPAGRS